MVNGQITFNYFVVNSYLAPVKSHCLPVCLYSLYVNNSDWIECVRTCMCVCVCGMCVCVCVCVRERERERERIGCSSTFKTMN